MIENDWGPEERREQERLSLDFTLNVYQYQGDGDAENTKLKLLGHIVDISRSGVMLLSQEPVETQKSLELILEIGLPGEATQQLAATAVSRWHRKDPNPGWFNNGFQFVELSESAETAINRLITTLSAL